MFRNLKLFFKKGTILTKESLCELDRYARDYLDINYSSYPDGILKGTEIISNDDRIIIRRGLIKYRGEIYRMAEDIDLSREISNWKRSNKIQAQTHYQLCFEEQERELIDNRESQQLFSLKLNCRLQSDKIKGIYFASFKLAGDEVFSLPKDNDLTDSNAWNMINCLYSCRNGYTYHPYIFKEIAKIIESKENLDYVDYLILNQIYNEGLLSIYFMSRFVNEQEKASMQESFLLTGEDDRKDFLRTFISSILKERKETVEENKEEHTILTNKRKEKDGCVL